MKKIIIDDHVFEKMVDRVSPALELFWRIIDKSADGVLVISWGGLECLSSSDFTMGIINALVSDKFIKMEGDVHCKITVINYEKYMLPEDKPKPKKAKKATEPKERYDEGVTMTKDEYARLVETYGDIKAIGCIEILSNYKLSSGKTYKSDYRAILSWVSKRYDQDNHKSNKTGNLV